MAFGFLLFILQRAPSCLFGTTHVHDTWRIIPVTKWLIHANTVTPVNKLLSPPTGLSISYNSPFTNHSPTNYIQPICSGCFVACAGLEVQMHVSASYRALAGVATAWWIQSASFSAFFWDHLQSEWHIYIYICVILIYTYVHTYYYYCYYFYCYYYYYYIYTYYITTKHNTT